MTVAAVLEPLLAARAIADLEPETPALLRQAAALLDREDRRTTVAQVCPGSGTEPNGGPGNPSYGYCPSCGGTYVLTSPPFGPRLVRRHARRPSTPVEEPAG
jgi:hypothetical protein